MTSRPFLPLTRRTWTIATTTLAIGAVVALVPFFVVTVINRPPANPFARHKTLAERADCLCVAVGACRSHTICCGPAIGGPCRETVLGCLER